MTDEAARIAELEEELEQAKATINALQADVDRLSQFDPQDGEWDYMTCPVCGSTPDQRSS